MVISFLIAALLSLAGQSLTSPSLERVTLNDLSFIAGRWHGTDGTAQVDEHWTAPEGNNMMGMFRVVREGKVSIYEMMSIESSEDGILLHLKQFKFGLATSAEKPDVINFKLSDFHAGEAKFSKVNGNSQIIFKKTSADGMTATLIKDGEILPYVYTRSEK